MERLLQLGLRREDLLRMLGELVGRVCAGAGDAPIWPEPFFTAVGEAMGRDAHLGEHPNGFEHCVAALRAAYYTGWYVERTKNPPLSAEGKRILRQWRN